VQAKVLITKFTTERLGSVVKIFQDVVFPVLFFGRGLAFAASFTPGDTTDKPEASGQARKAKWIGMGGRGR